MGNFTRAKEVNRAACKICTDKKDLESQFEKFEKGIKADVVGDLMVKSGLCILLEVQFQSLIGANVSSSLGKIMFLQCFFILLHKLWWHTEW